MNIAVLSSCIKRLARLAAISVLEDHCLIGEKMHGATNKMRSKSRHKSGIVMITPELRQSFNVFDS